MDKDTVEGFQRGETGASFRTFLSADSIMTGFFWGEFLGPVLSFFVACMKM